MITANGISLFLGGKELYNDISFRLGDRDKVGLTGKNGAGKSTLLKLIMGEYKPDKGELAFPKGTRICYLPQELQHESTSPILSEVQMANGEITNITKRLDEVNHAIATRTDYESEAYMELLNELTDLNDEFNMKGGSEVSEMAEQILKGLGFVQADLERSYSEFSGGWKMRVELAKLLVQNPDVLLLDEPTNHLDIESIQWLEDYLKKFAGTVVLISHDRGFLDAITKRTLEISNGKIYDYKFNYSNYIVKREEELEIQLQAYKNQQKHIEHTEQLINKFRAKKNKAAFAQSLIKKLDKMERIEVDQFDAASIEFRFPEPFPSGKLVAEIEGAGKSYEENVIFKDMDFSIARGEKIALIGKNGMGKSTLIKMMVGDIKYDGKIKMGHNVNIGYFAQDETLKLDPTKTVFETIDDIARGEIRKKVRNILGSFLFSGDDADKKVSVLSGGEKTRLALCKLLLQPYNFLILDEPTNHLDIVSKDVLKDALQNYTGTLLIVSHDRDFFDGLTDRIYYIKDQRIGIYFDSVKEFISHLGEKLDAPLAKEAAAPKEKSVHAISYEEQKKLKSDHRKARTRRSKIESEIEKLEKEVNELEQDVAKMDFSDGRADNEIFTNIQKKRKRMEEAMYEWEVVNEEIDALEQQLD